MIETEDGDRVGTEAGVLVEKLDGRIGGGLPPAHVAAGEHRRLLDCALKRDWKGAQATLEKHVHDCVTHMIGKRLVL